MIIEQVRTRLQEAIKQQFKISDVAPDVSYPDPQFGDLATNVAFELAGRLKKAPQQIAEELAAAVVGDEVAAAKAVNGFINLKLSDAAIWKAATEPAVKSLKGKTVVAEYSDPNPFKVLHAGHLYTTIVGDAVSNLLEKAGATVHRVNFGGDVGLHVAKAMWAIIQTLGGEHPEKLKGINKNERLEWVSEQYVAGTTAYEDDPRAKDLITEMNARIYKIQEADDRKSDFAQIYWTCREWSYDGFDALYRQLQIAPFEKYYPESETAPEGLAAVQEGLKKGIFEHSDGAVVYRGEPDGLHTRVFLNSTGLPTYEAKDLGLATLKWQDYHFDLGIIITANDIIEYMKVVETALHKLKPEITGETRHLTHGMVQLAGGAKMSSRKGNILRAVDVLEAAEAANRKLVDKDQPEVVLAAVKYAFLKQRTGGNVIYDPEESVGLTGNSGPYLQYAHARARSILARATGSMPSEKSALEPAEHRLLRRIIEFNVVFAQAVEELQPHLICTYLYELSQEFNRFYEGNRVVGDPRSDVRLQLVHTYADTLKRGLAILGISAPDHI